uniref:Ribosomal protein S7 n=1 Tax=Telonemida sp. TaxID=2652706 RepID=A0A5P8DK05_9EUKA|nr:ribosomal protein S7 [Telonemida sp.]
MNFKSIEDKIVCLLMKDGKKSVSQKLVHSSIEKASIQSEVSMVYLLKTAISNIRPSIDARSKKIGNSSYMIPYAITEKQSVGLAAKIFVNSARSRKEKKVQDKLVNEWIDAFNNRGASVKKKNDIHKLAETNKSFAFFR